MACDVIGLWSACSQDQAGVLGHNKGRREAVPRKGGGREGGGGEESGEIEKRVGFDSGPRQLVEDLSRPRSRNSWKGRKKRGLEREAAERQQRGERGGEFRRGGIGMAVAVPVTSGNDTVDPAEITALCLASFFLTLFLFTLGTNTTPLSNPFTPFQAFPV